MSDKSELEFRKSEALRKTKEAINASEERLRAVRIEISFYKTIKYGLSDAIDIRG